MAYFTASCDPPDRNKDFAASLGLDYPILSDPDGAVAKAYGIYNAEKKFPMRATFYIDKQGILRDIDKKVNTKSHGSDIAKKVAELRLAD